MIRFVLLFILMLRVSSIDICPEGSRRKDDSCVDCEPGLYQDEKSNLCRKCTVGQYRYDAISCKNCTVGTYRDTVGAADITQCHPCLTDKYQDHEGQISCKDWMK